MKSFTKKIFLQLTKLDLIFYFYQPDLVLVILVNMTKSGVLF